MQSYGLKRSKQQEAVQAAQLEAVYCISSADELVFSIVDKCQRERARVDRIEFKCVDGGEVLVHVKLLEDAKTPH